MSIPTDIKYAETHEWARKESDGTVSVGISHHAQDQLGDIVFVENPQLGRQLRKGEECGVVESVKAASDIYAPVSGEVVAINETLDDSPEKINESAYDAWMFRLRPTELSEMDALLDADDYGKFVESDAH